MLCEWRDRFGSARWVVVGRRWEFIADADGEREIQAKKEGRKKMAGRKVPALE